MEQPLYNVLSEKFGYSDFRLGQKEAVESVLANQDTLVMLPTGTGKSLCYQLPAYLMDGLVLIVSPLLSLMQDQVENLKLKGEKKVAALNSLTPYSERNRIFKQLGDYRFIYTSPEMLQNNEVMNHLKRTKISLFVIDEAHCISHWGTDFRPDYLALADVRKQLNQPTTMALTATATEQVRKEIISFLNLNMTNTNQIIQSVDRPEIKFIVEHCRGNKMEKIVEYVKGIDGAGIIYFMSKKLADKVAHELKHDFQIQAESYHSDIDGDDKVKIQQQFLKNKLQVICATSAFGMGFDKQDIRYVIHYHMPDSPEMYLQEVGRASRDGQLGLAILLYQPGDEQIPRRFIEDSLPSHAELVLVAKEGNNVTFAEESMLKLAQYFIQTHETIDGAAHSISQRKENKLKQVEYMMRYIYNEDCKREIILNYFNETKQEKLEICCSSCGLDHLEIIKTFNGFKLTKAAETASNSHWKAKFNRLYNID